MLIPVVCPRCETQYQLDVGLRGKRMRCPNAICRHVFEVPPAAPTLSAAPVPPTTPPIAKAPGPTRPAMPRNAPPPRKPPVKPAADETLDWTALAPPPVRAAATPAIAQPEIADADFPGDFPSDDTNDAPPPHDDEPAVSTAPRTSAAQPATEIATSHPRRRSLRIIAVMLLILLAAAGAGWWRWRAGLADRELTLADSAAKTYQEQDYATAAQRYQHLLRDFPNSEHAKKYAFLAELSDVRAGAYQPHESLDTLAASFGHVLEFLKLNASDPLLKAQENDAWQTLHDLAEALLANAESKESAEPLLLARHAWREARKYAPPPGKTSAEVDTQFKSRFDALLKIIEAKEQRAQLLARLDAWREQPTIDRVLSAKQLLADKGAANDADLQAKVADVLQAHRTRIAFVPNTSPAAPPKRNEDPYPSLAFAPALGKTRPTTVSEEPVLALARGVLYALDSTQGDIRWVRRLGIDTTRLPDRIAADEIAPARLLLLSSDQLTLTAVEEATGKSLWTHTLSGICLGAPVIVDHHALIATMAGRIEEIDLRGGRMHGWYQLDQPLPLGGVRMPGTPRVFFPGDKECLYEIDVAARACTAIHYSGHTSGSLAALPIPLPDPDEVQRPHLLWCTTKGASSAEMRLVELPAWRVIEPKLAARGWATLGMHADADQIALATDSGLLSLWGRRQKGNSDPLLFPRVLDHRLASPQAGAAAKALVAHVEGHRLWVLALGKLHLLHLDPTALPAPKLDARWGSPPTLGSPLHAAQTRRSSDGKTILFLTTQDTDSARCRISAVDGDSGEIYWQRQLGLVADQKGVVLEKYTLLPSGGTTFAVPREEIMAGAEWRFPRVEPMLDVEPSRLQAWHKVNDKILHLSWPTMPGDGRELHWRELGEPMHTATLPDVPQGPPAVGATCIVVPLRNGELARVPLGGGKVAPGPDWRGSTAEEHPALASHVAADRFVVADGRGTLTFFDAANPKSWERKGSATLPFRIIAPPLVLDAAKPRLVVADTSNTLTLLDGERLLIARSWPLGGKLSAGPFVVNGIGCIVDGKRLLAFDPERSEPRWENAFVADVIDTPLQAGTSLVVADNAGSIHYLSGATGDALRPPVTLQTNAAPTIAPLPLAPGTLLVPLTDGTAMLLPNAR